MNFLNYVLNHWSEISAVIIFIISTIAGVKKLKLSANESAKTIAQKLMFSIEKRADEYLTSPSGAEKFKLVVESGYALFGSKTRLFISKPAFEIIVQDLHDSAIKFLESEIKKQTPIVANPPLTITSNGNVTANSVTLTGNPIDPQITTP